jgi:hypothetical protein
VGANPKVVWLNVVVWSRVCARFCSIAMAVALASCGGGSMSTPSRQLMTITVQPAHGDAVAPSGTMPFSASGTFNQEPVMEDALTVQWSSSDPTVAKVDVSTGLATCEAAGGPVTITATLSGKKSSAELNCLSAPPTATGGCVYQCGSTRCGALTGYCASSAGNVCRQAYDPGRCPVGKPANSTMTDGCGVGIDPTRSCTP